MAGKRKPWDRRDDEHEESFHAFTVFRDLGVQRTCSQVAGVTGRCLRSVHEFSRRYDWVTRVGAWDRRVDQAKTRGELTAIERMHARHAHLALKLQDLTAVEMERYERRARARLARDDDRDDIENTRSMAATLAEAAKLERTARGEVTERVEAKINLSGLTLEELQQLKAIRAKLAQPTEGETDDDTEGSAD